VAPLVISRLDEIDSVARECNFCWLDEAVVIVTPNKQGSVPVNRRHKTCLTVKVRVRRLLHPVTLS
jgi:hypothetical protein